MIIHFLVSIVVLGLWCTPVYAAPVVRPEIKQDARVGSQEAGVKNSVGTRALLGTVVLAAKAVDGLTVKDENNKEYTVKYDAQTQFRRTYWGKSSLDEMQVGDTLTVIGTWLTNERSQIQAVLIRDRSIQKRNGVFFGDVTSVSANGFVMETKLRGGQTVTVSNTTRMVNRLGATIGQSTIIVGHRVRVIGLWDVRTNTITEVVQVKDFDLP